MAGTILYNTTNQSIAYIYCASSGGTVFGPNVVGHLAFDYFTDTAQVDDAIYFANSDTSLIPSDITLNVGTPLVATSIDIVWERYIYSDALGLHWEEITNCLNGINNFQTPGLVTFAFGGKYDWRKSSVNGSSTRFWVRARIKSVTGLTEGGANSTSAVTIKDGRVRIEGYTDSSYCTFSLVYDYLKTNFPYLGITKTLNHYDFTNISLYINSRLITINESFEIGQGNNPGQHNLSYLQMGNKISDYFGRYGSTLIINATANSYPCTFSTQTKMYGSNILSPRGAGYPTILGEWVDCNIDGVNIAPTTSGIIRNCRLYNSGTWIVSNGFFNIFDRNRVIIVNTFGLFYQFSVTITNLDYVQAGNINFFQLNTTSKNIDFNVTNPNPKLPSATTVSSGSHIVNRSGVFTATAASTHVFYYDDSAGTYTDYTTQFANATTNDAPLFGDVDDCYYFFESASSGLAGIRIEVNSTFGDNDYVYDFQKYYTGSWHSMKKWDRTNNFAITEKLYLQTEFENSTVTINGVSGYWFRIKIVSKGSSDVYVDTIKFCQEVGVADWNAYENYTANIKVIDLYGEPIENATVKINLDGVNLYTGLSDSNGDIVEQTLNSRRWFFDPINYYNNFCQIGEEVKNDYEIVISKDGYNTYYEKFTNDTKTNKSIVINKSVPDTPIQMIAIKVDDDIYQEI